MRFIKRKFSQLHVSHNDNWTVAFDPFFLFISFNVETTVTVQCLCLIDHHVIYVGLTTPILNVGTGSK